MDYNYFLSTYGFPIFGIAAFVALIDFIIMNTVKTKVSATIGGIIFYSFLISLGVMLVVGFLLPWGSPI